MSFIVKIKKQLALYELSVDQTEYLTMNSRPKDPKYARNKNILVIGGSGSGKSMTLKCIAGIETPDSGFISLNGRVLYDSSKKINLPPQKRNVGYLFQEYALFPTMTAAENISIVMKQKNPVQVQKWLEEYGLGDYADSYPDHLSGGQKKRVALAAVLVNPTDVLILDEPNASMDVMTEATIYRQYYEQIRGSGRIGILISHRLGSTRFCDRILVLKGGKIVQDGSFDELIEQEGLYKTMYEAQSQWYQDAEVPNTR